jgi:uncharacterized protein YcbK (DUF882 family)
MSRLASGLRLLALTVTLAAALPAATAEAAIVLHTVGKGQTLGRIAKRYHTSVDSLLEVNGIRRGQRIHPGLVLVIPEKGKEAEAAKKAAALRHGDEPDADRKGARGKGDKGALRDAANDKPDPSFARRPKRPGFVRMVRGTERFEAQFLGRRGRLVPQALAGLSHLLRSYVTNTQIPIDPRLASMIGLVSDHFGGRPLHVVSGFRPYTPTQYTPHSNHNAGRAMDFSVEGVPNTVLRDFCRTFRNAGVGYYPNSSFVHLDARTGRVFWIDYSSPGEPPRYDSPSAGADADEAARDVGGGGPDPAPTPSAGTPSAPVPGSEKTPPPSAEPADKREGTGDKPIPSPGNQENQGQSKPPP